MENLILALVVFLALAVIMARESHQLNQMARRRRLARAEPESILQLLPQSLNTQPVPANTVARRLRRRGIDIGRAETRTMLEGLTKKGPVKARHTVNNRRLYFQPAAA